MLRFKQRQKLALKVKILLFLNTESKFCADGPFTLGHVKINKTISVDITQFQMGPGKATQGTMKRIVSWHHSRFFFFVSKGLVKNSN